MTHFLKSTDYVVAFACALIAHAGIMAMMANTLQ